MNHSCAAAGVLFNLYHKTFLDKRIRGGSDVTDPSDVEDHLMNAWPAVVHMGPAINTFDIPGNDPELAKIRQKQNDVIEEERVYFQVKAKGDTPLTQLLSL